MRQRGKEEDRGRERRVCADSGRQEQPDNFVFPGPEPRTCWTPYTVASVNNSQNLPEP